MSTGSQGWIGVDLDGTLAEYHGWQGPEHIGAPIVPMVVRVRRWLQEGREVKIMTARVSGRDEEELVVVRNAIDEWCLVHIGHLLEVTCCKDYGMIELWDDRAVAVARNEGRVLGRNLI